MNKPNSLVVFGKTYSIEYKDKPSDVDIFKRESAWGQVDHWTHSIRIYAPDGFEDVEIWDTLIHELLHIIIRELKIEMDKEEENIVSLLALGLSDTFIRNGWVKKNEQ